MLGLLRNEANAQAVRFEAAKAAAPFIHAKLSSIEASGPDGGALQVFINKPA
jgi:hypothetical protein